MPIRDSLRWLDVHCLQRYTKRFKECSASQQIEMVDAIAYPAKATPGMQQGVVFFKRMRDLLAGGFLTSKMGMEDLMYVGMLPINWQGVPAATDSHILKNENSGRAEDSETLRKME